MLYFYHVSSERHTYTQRLIIRCIRFNKFQQLWAELSPLYPIEFSNFCHKTAFRHPLGLMIFQSHILPLQSMGFLILVSSESKTKSVTQIQGVQTNPFTQLPPHSRHHCHQSQNTQLRLRLPAHPASSLAPRSFPPQLHCLHVMPYSYTSTVTSMLKVWP